MEYNYTFHTVDINIQANMSQKDLFEAQTVF